MKNIVFYLLFTLSANATSFVQRDFSEFVHSTKNIVKGKVGRVWSDWVDMPDGSKQIYTFSEVKVDEVIKGKVESKVIKVKEIGGEKDGVGFNVSGTAEFASGEEVVLMLREGSGGDAAEPTFLISDMMMGKLNIEKNADGSEYLAGPALNLDVHPHLRAGDDKSKSFVENKKWTMEDLRRVAKENSQSMTQGNSSEDNKGALKLLSGKEVIKKNELQISEPTLVNVQRSNAQWLWYVGAAFMLVVVIFIFKRR